MSDCRYTVVVSSCDAYEDLWDPFFKIIKTEWRELEEKQIPIILNTESKSYSYDGLNITTLNLYTENDNPSWTERLRRTLNCISSDYIILLLDDFFMQDRVKNDYIEHHIKIMDQNRHISMICYKETYASKNIRDRKIEGFERRPLISKYKFSCQAALWRRTRLISYLKKNEDPWEWEVLGNWRSYRHPFHWFYFKIPGEENVFPYIHDMDGVILRESVYHGKWQVESVDPIFKKHDINIDYTLRGTVSDEELIIPPRIVKRKEDMPLYKQILWPVRPVYTKIKDIIWKLRYVALNIYHFF